MPAGLLATVTESPEVRQSYFAPTLLLAADAREPYAHASPDLVARMPGGTYVPLSAGSLFGQRRRFQVGAEEVEEFFASGRLKPGAQLRVTFEQAEEEPRCIAALRLTYPEGSALIVSPDRPSRSASTTSV